MWPKADVFLTLLLALICGAVLPEVDSTVEQDVSNVIFEDSEFSNQSCTTDYPSISNLSQVISSTTVDIFWKSLDGNPDVTGYQILYWKASTSSYANVTLDGFASMDRYTVTNLRPFTQYKISIRAVCSGHMFMYGVASMASVYLTRSAPPLVAPGDVRVLNNDQGNNPFNNSILVSWSQLPEDQWNGIMLNYVIVIADITPGHSQQITEYLSIEKTRANVSSLIEDHTYIITVSAESSGGLGVSSQPIKLTIDHMMEPSATSSPSYVNYWYYLAVPAGLVLAVAVTVVIICCKVQYERRKKTVQFVRDISTNIEEQKFPVGSDFDHAQRMEATRLSLHNRPLPAYPPTDNPPRTPSVSSMTTRLIDQTSPNQFQRGPSFSSADRHFHLQQQQMFNHHHPDVLPQHHPDILSPLELDPNHHQFRNRSVTSPQIPQLSQPLSDHSSATPSSVFTESNVPHPEETASSPNTPKAYEVPNDSKTCHQSVSPDMIRTNTLPNPRRPHTATGVMASQPVLPHNPQSSHSPVSFTHSSTDIRLNSYQQQQIPPPSLQGTMSLNKPPEIPPHRMNNKPPPPPQGYPTSPVYTQPESELYSEIPTNEHDHHGYPKISPPADSTLGHSTVMPTMSGGNESSIISSDAYSDYSNMPGECISPMSEIPSRSKLPSVEEYRRNDHHLSSESMSSFSTDSQSSSPSHSKISNDHHHMNSTGIARPMQYSIPEEHDYDEANSIITDNGSQHSSKRSNVIDLKIPAEAMKPNPYLSPVDIVPNSSTNGHSPKD